MKKITKKQKVAIGAITALAVLGIGGTSIAIANMDNSFPGKPVVTQNVKISMKKAESIALKEVTNGQIIQTELVQKNIPVYEIIVKQGNLEKQIEINANTGKITAKRSGSAIRMNHEMGHHPEKGMRGGKHHHDHMPAPAPKNQLSPSSSSKEENTQNQGDEQGKNKTSDTEQNKNPENR